MTSDQKNWFYIERRTMTKWRKDGDTFAPISPEKWVIDRDPQDVLEGGFFTGPYSERGQHDIAARLDHAVNAPYQNIVRR